MRKADSSWTVDPLDAGIRLDKFLAAPDRVGSRGRALLALERGKVFVNGDEADGGDAGRRLAAGDTVRVWMDRPGSSRARRGPVTIGDLRIVYEDDWILVVDKPAGMLTVPLDRRPGSVSAAERLREHLPSRRRRPFVVHRIDEYTSGLVVFARDAESQAQLKAQFLRHEPERVYWALVYGHPEPREGVWRDFVVWDDKALVLKQTHPRDPAAKEAISDYRVLERFAGVTLIEVRLETGKRNQIRLQARLRGHTLVGEQRYVFGPDDLRPIEFPRQALHARRLAFQHPQDGRPLEFEAPLPRDMADLIDRLRAAARRREPRA
jgi:23S rRNA pseudouridine1911/1915/1917 synthase